MTTRRPQPYVCTCYALDVELSLPISHACCCGRQFAAIAKDIEENKDIKVSKLIYLGAWVWLKTKWECLQHALW
jgi:hypothetical protein